MKLTKKPANRNGEITSKCHWHRRREAVACGAQTRRGYCRACHAQAIRPTPFDATIWLAALVALALALVGGVGCGGQDFTSMGGARPSEDAGTEGSLGSATGAGGGLSGGSPGESGGNPGSSGGSPGGSGGIPAGSGGGAPEAAAGGAPSGGGFTGAGGSAAGAGGSLTGSGGSVVGSGGSAAGSGGTVSEGSPCSNAAKTCDSSQCDPSCASQCWGAPLGLRWLACCPVSGSCGCVEPTKCL